MGHLSGLFDWSPFRLQFAAVDRFVLQPVSRQLQSRFPPENPEDGCEDALERNEIPRDTCHDPGILGGQRGRQQGTPYAGAGGRAGRATLARRGARPGMGFCGIKGAVGVYSGYDGIRGWWKGGR